MLTSFITITSENVSAFVTRDGLYQYKIMPCDYLIKTVTSGFGGYETYFDDVLLYSNSWNGYLNIIPNFFDRLRKATFNYQSQEDCIVHACVTFLGRAVGHGQFRLLMIKDNAITGCVSSIFKTA